MKHLLILLFCFCSLAVLSQNIDSISIKTDSINPTRYVTVSTIDIKGNYELVWKGLNSKEILKREKLLDNLKSKEDSDFFLSSSLYPYQPYKTINKSSDIIIQFDKDAMAANTGLTGSISLRAEINKTPIQIHSYYMTGQDKKSYGIRNAPALEISSHYVKMFIEAADFMKSSRESYGLVTTNIFNAENEVQVEKEGLERVLGDYVRNMNLLPEFRNRYIEPNLSILQEKYCSEIPDDSMKKRLATLLLESKGYIDLVKVNLQRSNIDSPYKDVFLITLETSIVVDLKVEWEGFILPTATSLRTKVLSKSTLDRVLDTIPSVSYNNLEEINRIYKRLADIKNISGMVDSVYRKSPDNFNRLKTWIRPAELLLLYMNYFEASGPNTKDAFLKMSSLSVIEFDLIRRRLNNNLNAIYDDNVQANDTCFEIVSKNIEKIAQAGKGVIIDYKFPRMPPDLKAEKRKYLKALDSIKDYDRLNFYQSENPDGYKGLKELINENLNIWTELFAKEAGKHIFKWFDPGIIKLSTNSPEPTDGDILSIYLIWDTGNGDSEDGNTSSIQEIPLGDYELKTMGWVKNEITESAFLVYRLNENLVSSDLSTSKWKPTAGVSWFPFSYYNTDRGKNSFLRWMEPSFGINVSYADFSQAKTFEIAAGPVIGLWRNRVFLTTGYNFMVDGQSPFYIGFGLSFSNIVNNITNNNNKND